MISLAWGVGADGRRGDLETGSLWVAGGAGDASVAGKIPWSFSPETLLSSSPFLVGHIAFALFTLRRRDGCRCNIPGFGSRRPVIGRRSIEDPECHLEKRTG